jgi:magnesium transporter
MSKKIGLPPGTVVHVGEKKTEKVKITIIDYDATELQEKEAKDVEECFPFKDTPTVTWMNIDGIHDVEIIKKIGDHFNLHPLLQEDIVNTTQRPKYEDFDDHLFVVLKMLHYDTENDEIKTEQLSLVIGSNFVISFQEIEKDVFNLIRERIRNNKGRVRKMGADYLAYVLLDAVVDNYFVIMERIGDRLEDIEDKLIEDPNPEILQIIHDLKREMIFLRKSVWPLREVVSILERGESPLIQEKTQIYLRDLYDHTIQVIDNIETFRDIASGMLDIYLSSISHRMNQVMKVLTIIATIFIPLTFIAGVYGMNFKYMPELEWKSGYFLIMGLMAAIGILMLFYFKKKKWL